MVSYTSLYEKLKDLLTEKHNHDVLWFVFIIGFGYIPIAITIILVLSYLTFSTKLAAIVHGPFICFSLAIAISILLTGIKLISQKLRSSVSDVEPLAIELLCEVKRPITGVRGLLESDLKQLRGFAETEQSSADWRGSYMSITVISSIVYLSVSANQSINWLLKNLPTEVSWSLFEPFYLEYGWFVVLVGFLWAIAMFGILFFISFIFRQINDFLNSEWNNRAINYACRDAIAILKALNLAEKDPLNDSDKEIIANKLGFIYIDKRYSIASNPNQELNLLLTKDSDKILLRKQSNNN